MTIPGTPLYLEALDEALGAGVALLRPEFTSFQRDWLLAQQLPDGGFPGRRGASDLYYTEFALRLATLLDAPDALFARASDWLSGLPCAPRDVIECFSLLNSARLLGRRGLEPGVDLGVIGQTLAGQQANAGGYARAGCVLVSAYATFIACLCQEMLAAEDASVAGAREAILGLRQPDGGFAEDPVSPSAQTNATAAAVAFLTMTGGCDRAVARPAIAFLGTMQRPGGGLSAHALAPTGDLLSTFTGLLTVLSLAPSDAVSLAGIARFVGSLACPGGGFRGWSGDLRADVEYTYYGLGCLAALKGVAVAGQKG